MPIDFTPASEAAGRRAVALSRATGADVILLHVIAHFPEDIPVAPVAPEGADAGEFLRRDADERLKEFAARIGGEGAQRTVLLSNHASKSEIARVAHERDIDLIVLGVPAHEGVLHPPDSTASAVVGRARCDVLVVRPRGE